MAVEPWDWDEADLSRLIADQVDEGYQLEYKAAGALSQSDTNKNDISKDVSAFANSGGGTLVYGVEESSGQRPRHPVGFSPIDPAVYSKEWLDQVIGSRIYPRVSEFRIKQVGLAGIHRGRVVYVVHVPRSTTAHQASDHKYYRRFNFQSVSMNHYEIIDVMNRAAHPKIVAEVDGISRQPHSGYDNQDRVIVQLSVRLLNVGTKIAEKVGIQFWIPEGYNLRGRPEPLSVSGGQSVNRDGTPCRAFIYYHRHPQGVYPLFPNTEHQVLDGSYAYINVYLFKSNEETAKSQAITWEVYADDAPPHSGSKAMYELFFTPSSA